jgi:hypothetical protein
MHFIEDIRPNRLVRRVGEAGLVESTGVVTYNRGFTDVTTPDSGAWP